MPANTLLISTQQLADWAHAHFFVPDDWLLYKIGIVGFLFPSNAVDDSGDFNMRINTKIAANRYKMYFYYNNGITKIWNRKGNKKKHESHI